MAAAISIIPGQKHRDELSPLLSPATVAAVETFHRSLPTHRKTPLVALPALAKKLGVRNIFVKDESPRFGLNSFKGLGATYAIAKIIAKMTGVDETSLNYAALTTESIRAKVKNLVFVTATDGNHGKSVAWAASIFGCKVIVYMPMGSKECRAEAIRTINNTTVEITALNYDDTVRLAAEYAKKPDHYLVQDTGFDGYEDIPSAIIQGYTTMASEALAQLADHHIEKPSHLFLQAGVGSMAGSILGYLAHYYHKKPPVTTIVEPATVACIYQSAKAGDGAPHPIGGNPVTIMAGLNCGEPNPFTWPILRDYASFYASCPDWVTECGMKTLAHPIGQDANVVSGESGAVGLGLLVALCSDQQLSAYRQLLGLDETSTILLFSTEGNTDPESYDAIVSR
ncbi:MAG: diaminopropionate ammonia-lyase [Negativicutes bacterium]|nr:diaminopropionate ammonia-lyase [Negativicutes bacterium]